MGNVSRRCQSRVRWLSQFLQLFFRTSRITGSQPLPRTKGAAPVAAGIQSASFDDQSQENLPVDGTMAFCGLRLKEWLGEQWNGLGADHRRAAIIDGQGTIGDRRTILEKIEKRVMNRDILWPKRWSGERFWAFFGGSPAIDLDQKGVIADRLPTLNGEKVENLIHLLMKKWFEEIRLFGSVILVNKIYAAFREGEMGSLFDADGARAAGERSGHWELPLLVKSIDLFLNQWDDKRQERLREELETTPLAFGWALLGDVSFRAGRWRESGIASWRAIELEDKYALPYANLALALFKGNQDCREAETLARRAMALGAKDAWLRLPLATIQAAKGPWPETVSLIEPLFNEADHAAHVALWPHLLFFFQRAVQGGRAASLIDLLDKNGFGDRWLPLRAALTAVAEGSEEPLRRLAPEVRSPAMGLLRTIVPGGL